MLRLGVSRTVTGTLALAACLVPAASVAARGASGPPAGVDPSRPTVSGTLVAKPVAAGQEVGPIACPGQATSGTARTFMSRGLVICTGGGNLVLLQLSGGTRIFDRTWRSVAVGRLKLGNHINAWGVLNPDETVLYPTVVVQDTSVAKAAIWTVRGVLIAKPGEGTSGRFTCGDQDRSAAVRTLVGRGLVVCSARGTLVLLELSPGTRILGRDRTAASVSVLTDGDHILARGSLQAGGSVLDPTRAVVDTDIQLRATNSQDFVVDHDVTLTLDVLASAAGGPVKGMIHAERRGTTQVSLCGGRSGSWSDLTVGLTIDISQSIFNRRIMAYVDTDTVKVVSCS